MGRPTYSRFHKVRNNVAPRFQTNAPPRHVQLSGEGFLCGKQTGLRQRFCGLVVRHASPVQHGGKKRLGHLFFFFLNSLDILLLRTKVYTSRYILLLYPPPSVNRLWRNINVLDYTVVLVGSRIYAEFDRRGSSKPPQFLPLVRYRMQRT